MNSKLNAQSLRLFGLHSDVNDAHRAFLVKNAENCELLRPEHPKETHFLKRRISVDRSGWHVELDQR